jgi:hypothetical protein
MFTHHSVPDVVILGDASKYEFLAWLLGADHTANVKGKKLWIQYGKRYSFREEKDGCHIQTANMIPNIELYFTDELDIPLEIVRDVGARPTKYFIFEEFPYEKRSTYDIIESIHASNTMSTVLVILMDLPRHQGSTDLTKPGEDIQAAREGYVRCGVSVTVAKKEEDVIGILNWHELISVSWGRQVSAALCDLRDRIDEFEADYDLLIDDFEDAETGILGLAWMDRICSFQSIERNKKGSIWENYTEELLRCLFPRNQKGGIYPVVDLYGDVLTSPIVLWDVGKDKQMLAEWIQDKLKEFLQEHKAGEMICMACPVTREDYLRITQVERKSPQFGVETKFRNSVESFIRKELPCAVKERLKQRLEQIEGAMT